MRILNHVLEVRLSARQPWSHMRLHRRPYWSHFVWGRLSAVWGQPHLEPIRVCSDCGEAIEQKSAGDETWDWCESCQQLEGPTRWITMEEFESR